MKNIKRIGIDLARVGRMPIGDPPSCVGTAIAFRLAGYLKNRPWEAGGRFFYGTVIMTA
jgi:hypothetical protein